ncbi:hypothetical protein CXG81DRAFT_16805 [Caulochytrium protostelioides]|uniref:Uncharacterized protein n=1 Tax=Caulochytrium protostelioides TaxID=1555241 RepID=A0A4P9XDV0_9FUNG|nr:hypothetical protein CAUPRSCDRAFT_10563 [Caulochytrium protostelioides]RKP03707.1 hypothetical protein CXG81DRAFT_16805 [Caulochytrium protostelioides]|eukprot:RKP03707.1 hypothetical protein CXG81DRAFT_16805 [Caulochytrium protostelioides]
MSRIIKSQNRAVAPMGMGPTQSDFKSPLKDPAKYDDAGHESKPLKTKIKEKFGAATHNNSHDDLHADDSTTLYSSNTQQPGYRDNTAPAPGFYSEEHYYLERPSTPNAPTMGQTTLTSSGEGMANYRGTEASEQMSPSRMEQTAMEASEQFRNDNLQTGLQQPRASSVPPMPEMPTADIGMPYRRRGGGALHQPSVAEVVNPVGNASVPATQTNRPSVPPRSQMNESNVTMAQNAVIIPSPVERGQLQLTAPPEDPILILLHRTGGWNRFLSQFISHLQSVVTAEKAAAEAHDSHYSSLLGHDKKHHRRSFFGNHTEGSKRAPASRAGPVSPYNQGPSQNTPTMAAMTSMTLVPGRTTDSDQLAQLPDNLATMSRLMGESHARHVEILEGNLIPRLKSLAAEMNQCHGTLKKARREMAGARSEERHAFQDAVDAYHAALAAAHRGLGHFVHDPNQGCDPWMYRLAADSALMRMHNRHSVREEWCQSTVSSYLRYDRDVVVRTVRDCVAQYHRIMTPPSKEQGFPTTNSLVLSSQSEDFTEADDREARALQERIMACPKVAAPPQTYPERDSPLANAVHCGVLMTQGGPKELAKSTLAGASSSAKAPTKSSSKSTGFWSRFKRSKAPNKSSGADGSGAEALMNGTHTLHRGWTPVFGVVSAIGYLHLFPGHAMPPAWTFTTAPLPSPTQHMDVSSRPPTSMSSTMGGVQPIFGLQPMNGNLLAPDGTARIQPSAHEVEMTMVLPFASLYVPRAMLTPSPTAHGPHLSYSSPSSMGGVMNGSDLDDLAMGHTDQYPWHEFNLVFHPPSVPPTTSASRRDRHKKEMSAQSDAQTFRFRIPSACTLTENPHAQEDALSWRHVLGQRALVTYEAMPKQRIMGDSYLRLSAGPAVVPMTTTSTTTSAMRGGSMMPTPPMTRSTSVTSVASYPPASSGARMRTAGGLLEVSAMPPPFTEDRTMMSRV